MHNLWLVCKTKLQYSEVIWDDQRMLMSDDKSAEIVGPQPPDVSVDEATPVNGETNGKVKHGGPPQTPLDSIAEEEDEDGDGAMVGPVLPRAKKRRVRLPCAQSISALPVAST